MAEIVNLRRARKAKARTQAAKTADTNRARHGLTKAERVRAKAEAERTERALDGLKLEP
ncbi:MAG: DUF4169 family protein [Novosphingobium sp.]|uniref:DUF4169 family protein n=1 Tax=Novosphingobium sp. TaxID=1874826 RepID=UPI0032BB7301